MTIRAYNPGDKPAVLALFRLNTPAFFAESEEEDLEYYLEHEAHHYFVLEVDGLLAGCGGYNLADEGKSGKISWDIFHPQQQGKGFGQALTAFRIRKLIEEEKVQHISVRTSQMAYRFYEKQGFVLEEMVADYWAPGFDLYRMRWEKR